MSDHTHAINAAMKAAGFDPLNHVARKSVEDAVAAYLSELGGAVTVKPLEWFRPPGTHKTVTLMHAKSVVGLYEAFGGGAHYLNHALLSAATLPTNQKNLEAAQSSCQSDFAARILSAIAAPPDEGGGETEKKPFAPTHRHKKRGSTYQVVGNGRLQVDGDLDMEKVTIYQGEDGAMWVRPDYEFNDGRFEALRHHTKEGGK